MVGFLLNPTQLGFYAPAASLTSRVQTVGNGMVGFLLPSMSRAQAKSDLPTMRRMSILSIRILLCFAMFISIASVFFGREFIRIWLDNPDFTEKTYPVLVFLSLALLVRIPSAAVTSSLAGLGQVQLLANRAMLEAGTTVVLQLALAVPFGLPGVAAGLLISQFLVVAALQPQYLAKAIEMPVRSFLSQSLARPAVAGLLTVVAAATLTRFWPIGVLADPLTTWIGMLGIRDSIANRVAQLFELGIQVAVVGAAMFPPVFFLCLDRDARSAFRPKWRKTATPPPASLDSTERGTN
ncbi:MAG: hypothetical protein NT069_28700 [Planctomycetota bacterium]|nr:hypothetical protein [Planctomycetota bacterium]